MRIIKAVERGRHLCDRPGWRSRRKLGLGIGSIIECSCGQQWEFWQSKYSGDVQWVKR